MGIFSTFGIGKIFLRSCDMKKTDFIKLGVMGLAATLCLSATTARNDHRGFITTKPSEQAPEKVEEVAKAEAVALETAQLSHQRKSAARRVVEGDVESTTQSEPTIRKSAAQLAMEAEQAYN